MPYPVILNGDHAEFESDWAASGKPDHERPDWPLPSFDAQDWAKEFCRVANGFGFRDAEGNPIDEGWMICWFANALMRGFDEHAARAARSRWQNWFAWRPVRLLTMEWAWLRTVRRRQAESGEWSYGTYDYANRLS